MSEQTESKSPTNTVNVSELTRASDYKYINAREGQIGLGLLQGNNTDKSYVLLHFTKVQFLASGKKGKIETIPTVSALASVEMDLEGARLLHESLTKLLDGAE